MAFTSIDWSNGDVITQEKIQAINDGIYDTHYANAGAHNSIYRGKSLGSSVTSAQESAISAGTYDDIFIGDYWTISSVNYDVAGCNYIYNAGSTSRISKNHLALVPRTRLYNAPMNTTGTTSTGYAGSAMFLGEAYTVSDVEYTGLTDAENTIKAAFGDYVMTYEAYFTNAAPNGYPSAGAWVGERICDIMNEEMVYGSPIRQQMSFNGTAVYNHCIEKTQLPLFALLPNRANIGSTWWLRDIVTSTAFATVSGNGAASGGSASGAQGVRPCFYIT